MPVECTPGVIQSTTTYPWSNLRTYVGTVHWLDMSGGVFVCRAFFTTPGVDPRLVPQYWFRNHYRWLTWKLAAMEVCFPQHLAGRSCMWERQSGFSCEGVWVQVCMCLLPCRCLTPNWLMMQMKYRYDREIDNAHRYVRASVTSVAISYTQCIGVM